MNIIIYIIYKYEFILVIPLRVAHANFLLVVPADVINTKLWQNAFIQY